MPPARHVNISPAVQSRWLLIVSSAAAALMPAQDIIMSTPRDVVQPPVLRDQQLPAPASQPPGPPETPFKLGTLVLRPRLSYGYLNAEGLPAPDGRRVASEIHTMTAGLGVDLGDEWSLDYSPSWRNYTARAMRDSFDQYARLSGAFALKDWGIQLSETYAQSSPTLVETGQQIKEESWSSNLSASYAFSPGVQLQASGAMDERYTDIAADMRTWTSGVLIKLVFSPRLSLSLGPRFNYNEIIDAPDMYSESYSARLSWTPANKLTLALSTGMQYSHSNSAAGLDLTTPLLDFSLGYQPFATTTISFAASQTASPAYSGGQMADTFSRSVSLYQRLLGRLYFNASYTASETTYNTTDGTTTAARNDAVQSFSTGLSAQMLGRLLVSASYLETQNESTASGYSFSSRQYGIQLSYSY